MAALVADAGDAATMTAKTIHVLNGPNLSLLGTREPTIYGSQTLADIAALLEVRAAELGLAIVFQQTNSEGRLVDLLHAARSAGAHAVLLNAGAYTHTSIALLDAIRAIELPVIEVHLSNPHTREAFRHTSYVGMAAKGTISGFGAHSYLLALDAAAQL
jgi:3-dehydroquinate dehydratase II